MLPCLSLCFFSDAELLQKEGTLKEDEDAKAFTPLRFVLPEGAEAIQGMD